MANSASQLLYKNMSHVVQHGECDDGDVAILCGCLVEIEPISADPNTYATIYESDHRNFLALGRCITHYNQFTV